MSEQKRQKEHGREGGRGVGCVSFANQMYLIQEKVCESDREKENAQEGGVKKEKRRKEKMVRRQEKLWSVR